MRKILSLVLALAMLLGMCSFASADETVTLEWYVLEGPAPGNEMVWAAINDYMVEKIGVKINFHYINADEYTAKMNPMMMNGTKGIDIVNVNGQLPYVEWAKKGAFVAMDDLLQYAPKTAELVGEDFFNAMRIDGKIYAIPSVKDSVQMYSARFNQTMNDALGLTVPTEINGYKDMVAYLYDAKAARDANPEYAWLSEQGVPVTRCYADFEKYIQFEKINSLLGTNVAGIEGIAAAAADGSEVFSIYQTAEYAEMCKTIMQMRLDGILYNGDVWYYDSDQFFKPYYVLNDIGSGWVEAGINADDPVQKRWTTAFVPFQDNVAMTSYLHQAANAITVSCQHPEKAMQALELINTDPFVATALRFGLEGTHWTLNEDGTLNTEGTLNANNDNNFYWYGAQFGAIVYSKVPASKGTAQFMDKLAVANAKAKAGNMGFIFDPTPVQNEVAACSAKIDEFNTNLKFGKHETMEDVNAALAAFSAALDEAGIAKVVAECQAQLNAFLGK